MKKNVFLFIILANLIFIGTIEAQKDYLVSGNLEFLKQANAFNVVFSYDSMAVGEFKHEKDYIQKKVNELNESKQGKGDKWLANWNKIKIEQTEPLFIKSLNGQFKKVKLKVGQGLTTEKFTILVETLFLEQGFYVTQIVNNPSVVSLIIIVYETADKRKEVAKFKIAAEGTGGAYPSAYSIAANALGKYLRKAITPK